MKKTISLILTVLLTLGCLCVPGFAADTQTDAVQVQIAPFLYKSALYQMEFPSNEDYDIKEKSKEGDYAISHKLNDLSYTFVFPAGTTDVKCFLSLNGERDWRGVSLNSEDNPNYWEKDDEGNIDYSKPFTFRRDEVVAERDEYGVLYRDYLRNADVGGFRDIDTIYWKLTYICGGETFTQRFDIKVYDYDAAEKHTVKAVNFNVAGLPFNAFYGMDIVGGQKYCGEYLSENGFDIAAVQEDFNFHSELVSNMNGFNYETNHMGGVPGGDGLNIFTKDMPIYNEARVAWEESCGILSDGSDELTPKGFVYSVIDVGNGVYVDFYNIHADAYGGEGSIKARSSQYKQLAEFIKARSAENDRPVIVTGDFNNHIHVQEDDAALYNTLCVELGLKDAWIEKHNNGNYFNFYDWHITKLPAWGNWDSVERFLYKGGSGVDIVVSDFRYVEVLDDNGKAVSDHSAAECDFTFIKTEDFTENTGKLEIVEAPENNVLHMLTWIFKALYMIISDIRNLPELFKDLIA